MAEVFVSTDVEADGPIPGPYSMLSFASAAFGADGKLIATFSTNLEVLPDASTDPETMAWWRTQPQAWADCRMNPQPPSAAMAQYARWLRDLPGKPVFVAYPASYDFMFVYWYLMRFVGESPFSYTALDMKSYAMAVLGTDFSDTNKSTMPPAWLSKHPHTHRALDDAIGQGHLFLNMISARNAFFTAAQPEEGLSLKADGVSRPTSSS